MSALGSFRRFDLGNKAVDGSLFDRSILGALVTVVSVVLMTVLFLSELFLFLKTETSSHMTIADFHEQDTVSIRLHVTFPHVECPDLEVIADGARGETDGADSTGVAIRPASKAETKGFQRKAGMTGCTLDGTLLVPRAGGSVRLHVMHHDRARVMRLGGFLATTKGETRSGPGAVAGANVSHKIHDFSFGPIVQGGIKGERNPLANSAFSSLSGPGQVRYSLKVVPISHRGVYGHEQRTHTYASNVGFIPEDEVIRLPSVSRQWVGVDFEYDFTPVMVRYTQTRKSFFEFLTSVCAIVGGIHTVSGLLVQTLQGISREKMD